MVNGCSSVIGLFIAAVGIIGLTGVTLDGDKMVAAGAANPAELGGIGLFALGLFVLGFVIWIASGWFSDDTSNKT